MPEFVTKLSCMDPAQALAEPMCPASAGEGSFSCLGWALFSGQRLEKQELSLQINLSPTWWEGFNFKDKSEANDGEAYALVYLGRGRAFSGEWSATPFLMLFWSLMSSYGSR